MTPTRLAVIDADSGFVRVLTKRLDALGWRYELLDGPVPPHELVAMRLNAVLVDLATVGPDAAEYVEQVAAAIPGLGLVVCSPRSSVAQRVRGLRLGADDWIDKPVHPEEVIARIEAVARRRRGATAPVEKEPVLAGELEIRPDQFQAFVAGGSLDLTRREFELLQLLADARGQVLPREEIYQRVWGYAMAHGDRSVDVFIRKLRQKLEARSPAWVYIHTHFGIGYRFEPEPRKGPGSSGEGSGAEAAGPVAASPSDPDLARSGPDDSARHPRTQRERPSAELVAG